MNLARGLPKVLAWGGFSLFIFGGLLVLLAFITGLEPYPDQSAANFYNNVFDGGVGLLILGVAMMVMGRMSAPPPTAAVAPAIRPGAVTALAFLFALAGLLELALNGFAILSAGFFGVFNEASVFLVVLALMSFGTAWGLWTGQKWSYWVGVVVSVLLVLSFALFDIIGGFIGVFALFTFSSPTVKAWFNKSLR